MAQVPYSPVPQVAPTEQGAPRPQVNAPVEAFGGAIAHAVTNLGGSVQHAGDELFTRAVALQNLQNESEAREADAGYMIKAGDLHATYNSLQGQDRVKAFPKYAKDLEELRQTSRQALSTDMARKMFDGSSLSTMSRSIFNGAGAAASAAKEYHVGTLAGQMHEDARSVEENPRDETLFREKTQRTRQNAIELQGAHGFDATNPATQDFANKAVSALVLKRLNAVAQNEPFTASKMLEQYKTDGLLYGDDVEKAETKIRAYSHTTGADTVARNVMEANLDEDGGFKKSPSEMQDEVAKQLKQMFPGDPTISTAGRGAFDHVIDQHYHVQQQNNRIINQTMDSYIEKGVTNPALLPPSFAAQLTDTQIKQFKLKALGAQRAERAQTNLNEFNRLTGLYNNDRDKFLDADIYTIPGLNSANQNHFTKLQRDAVKQWDPRGPKMMGLLFGNRAGEMHALGYDKRPDGSNDDYNTLTGAMVNAREAWTDTHGKPPSDQEILEKIFPEVARTTVRSKIPIFGSDTHRYQEPRRKGWDEQNMPVLQQMFGPEPSEAEIQRVYNRQMYKTIFEAKSPKAQDRVP